MMKNEVGTVLRPTVNSTLRTPCASDGWPLKSLSMTLVLMRSAVERPSRRSTKYGIRLTAAPVSTNILFTGLPSMKPLRYNPFRCLYLFSLGFSKVIGRGQRSSCAMANSSGWGARNSDGSTNTMFTSADGFSSAFVCLGCHSFLGGCLSTLRGCLTCSARSGRAFLSTSRYLASASSRLRKRCTLRFCERLSPSGHHRGRWYLSSSFDSRSPLVGPKRRNTDVSPDWRVRGLHSRQSSIVGNRLMPEFQQYLKNGQCQWSRTAYHLPSVLPLWYSYSSSSDSYRRRYWYWYFSRSRLEAGS